MYATVTEEEVQWANKLFAIKAPAHEFRFPTPM